VVLTKDLQVFIGGEYYLPLYFQSTHATGPLLSGVLVMPYMLMEALGGVACGIITEKYGAYRELIITGCVLMTLGTGLYIALDAKSSIGKIIAFELVAGSGCGLLFQPVIVAIQAFTAQEDIATATSTLGFVRNMATSLGVIIGGIVFQNGMTDRQSVLRAANLPQDILSKLSGSDAAANVVIVNSVRDPVQKLVIKQAFAWSLRNMWVFYTCVGAIGVVASAFVKRGELSEEHVETRTGLLGVREKEPVEGVELGAVV
jgi:MFS family permease